MSKSMSYRNYPEQLREQIEHFAYLTAQILQVTRELHKLTGDTMTHVDQHMQWGSPENGFYTFYPNGRDTMPLCTIMVLTTPSGWHAPTENEEPQGLQVLVEGLVGDRFQTVDSLSQPGISRLSLGEVAVAWDELGDLEPWLNALKTWLQHTQEKLDSLRIDAVLDCLPDSAKEMVASRLRAVADLLNAGAPPQSLLNLANSMCGVIESMMHGETLKD